MSKGRRIRAQRQAKREAAEREAALFEAGYSQKLRWAADHIDALDESIQGCIDGGGYTLIDKPDPKTDHHVLYAQIKQLPTTTWALLAGDVVHNLRCALDHMVYAALDKHCGGVPDENIERADFPIMGMHNMKGGLRTNADADFASTVKRNLGGDLPDQFEETLRELQPYKRGGQYASHELWLIHDLDRVDKHRHLHVVTATANLTHMSMGGTGHFPYFWFGGGEVEHDDKVCEWADPTGPAPNLQATIAKQIVLGKPETGAGRDLVSLLEALRTYVETDVVPALRPFL